MTMQPIPLTLAYQVVGDLVIMKGTNARKRRADHRHRKLAIACVALLMLSELAAAQTITTLVSFDGSNGASPQRMNLVQGRDGNLWGTTTSGGPTQVNCPTGYPGGCGTIFNITPSGTLTTVFNFTPSSGRNPEAGLVLGTDGNFYAVTTGGGSIGGGTAFKVAPDGTVSVLFNFYVKRGYIPVGALIQGSDGSYYGTTLNGGNTSSQCGGGGCGTVFKVTASGKLTTLHDFDSTDGNEPTGELVQGTDGNFYGTTAMGGPYNAQCGGSAGCGAVFKITASGNLTTLHDFDSTDGAGPEAGLAQGQDGNFYGTASGGGTYTKGTVFKITPGGQFTTLHNFAGSDGGQPAAHLVLGTDGNFYGTTAYSSIFQMTPAGTLTSYNFPPSGPSQPLSGLVQHTNGSFYGVTYAGGTNGLGTIYKFDTGLKPFVRLVSNSGKVGSSVEILGGGLTGTTSVTFNGVQASFTIVSDTYLTATVPGGAQSGSVQVTTSGGTLTSSQQFRVTPQITKFSPTSGPVGTVVAITGASLTQTTKITFGGVKATTFTVNSDTQVTATVPTGALTGKIGVTTLGGTATSNTSFTVTP